MPPESEAIPERPPRDNLVRALVPGGDIPRGVELRANDGGMPTMFGHFAVFNRWTEISSLWEGNFMERIAPGAFRKTFSENRHSMRALFQHGQDPQVGDKPMGPIGELREDDTGGYYEVPLLDTSYNRDIRPGLEAGLYGASFRFRVMKEEITEEPKPSAANPRGLLERTVREAHVFEFGPVTFPAYASATAGLRSMTDAYIEARIARQHGAGAEPHSEPEPGPSPTPVVVVSSIRHISDEEWLQLNQEILRVRTI